MTRPFLVFSLLIPAPLIRKIYQKSPPLFPGKSKSAVCFLLEVGFTEQEVEAITRQSREMIRYYAMEMKRHKLAKLAIEKWEQASLTMAVAENGT